MFRRLFGGASRRERSPAENQVRDRNRAADLYDLAVRQARTPFFYRDLGVPDTVDGRFEMIVLHVFLILHALGDRPKTAQHLFDRLFADMDSSLREMGAGDMSVGRKVKVMASAFYGRCGAYGDGLRRQDDDQKNDELTAAVRRNVYPGVLTPESARGAAALAAYMRRESTRLLAAGPDGQFRFAAPEEPPEEPPEDPEESSDG